jgi:hypothetical protein
MNKKTEGGHCTVDPAPHDTFVTERLAEGLARQAIRDWRERVAQSQTRVIALAHRQFSTSKGVARVVRDVQRLLEPLAFHSVSTAFKRKGVYQAWMLPALAEIDGTEYLAIELDLYAVDLDGFRPDGSRQLGFIHPHALARMFLRMQTTAFADVRKQIDSTLNMYAALAEACRALQLRQMIVPTRIGHFRCDVRADVMEPCALIAKTWIATLAAGQRDLAVVDSIANVLIAWTARASPGEKLQIIIPMKGPPTLVSQLVEALRPHTWLTEPYEERADHLTEMWNAARRQAK